MIWYILGYMIIGTIGSLFLAGVIGGVVIIKRGYIDDDDEIFEYMTHLSSTRWGEQRTRIRINNVIGDLVWLLFLVTTWPVEFLRSIFLDIPEAIKMYESQHGIEEHA